MGDERELKEALASILHAGLVCLRGSSGKDAAYVAVESGHLHNLPRCLAHLTPDDLRYYYEVERPRYLAALKRLGGEAASAAPAYGHHWAVIEASLRRGRKGGRW